MYPILSYSSVAEDEQKQDVPPGSSSTDSDIPPASSSPSPLSSDSELSPLETTKDYIRLWPKTSDPNSQIKYEVKRWPYTSKDPEDSNEVYQPLLLCPLTQARGLYGGLAPFP